MKYLVKTPFATTQRAYSEGEVVADVPDAENLVKAGYLLPIEPQPEDAQPGQKTKRGKK